MRSRAHDEFHRSDVGHQTMNPVLPTVLRIALIDLPSSNLPSGVVQVIAARSEGTGVRRVATLDGENPIAPAHGRCAGVTRWPRIQPPHHVTSIRICRHRQARTVFLSKTDRSVNHKRGGDARSWSACRSRSPAADPLSRLGASRSMTPAISNTRGRWAEVESPPCSSHRAGHGRPNRTPAAAGSSPGTSAGALPARSAEAHCQFAWLGPPLAALRRSTSPICATRTVCARSVSDSTAALIPELEPLRVGSGQDERPVCL